MEILGHSQISVTMNTYSHVTQTSSREGVARVEVWRVNRPTLDDRTRRIAS